MTESNYVHHKLLTARKLSRRYLENASRIEKYLELARVENIPFTGGDGKQHHLVKKIKTVKGDSFNVLTCPEAFPILEQFVAKIADRPLIKRAEIYDIHKSPWNLTAEKLSEYYKKSPAKMAKYLEYAYEEDVSFVLGDEVEYPLVKQMPDKNKSHKGFPFFKRIFGNKRAMCYAMFNAPEALDQFTSFVQESFGKMLQSPQKGQESVPPEKLGTQPMPIQSNHTK